MIKGRVNRLLVSLPIVILLLCAMMQPLHAQTTVASKEYRIKAVFLFNFTQFVEWPGTAFGSPSAPFVIGILGDDPFGAYLDETVQNEKVGTHPIVVQRFHDPKEVKNCQILFINAPDADKMKEQLGALNNHTMLTVGDGDSFVKSGGMVRFFTENNKIRLQINPEAAKVAELNISSKLLRVSDIFDARNPPR